MSIMFMSKFGKQPMHFFGAVGSVSFLFGFVALIVVLCLRLASRISLTNSVWFYLSILFVLMGTMLFLAGFIGEMVSRNSQERNKYNVKDQIR
jgi:hypothetical protein